MTLTTSKVKVTGANFSFWSFVLVEDLNIDDPAPIAVFQLFSQTLHDLKRKAISSGSRTFNRISFDTFHQSHFDEVVHQSPSESSVEFFIISEIKIGHKLSNSRYFYYLLSK